MKLSVGMKASETMV